jgi:PAS domain S-box-containing protein
MAGKTNNSMSIQQSDVGNPRAAGVLAHQILIIDDESAIVNVLDQALKFKGYQTRSCTSSEEALHIFREEGEFDVVITDLMMPEFSGIELLEVFKQVDSNCEVIVLTGFGSNETAVEALKKGAYDYLKKPTNIDELFICVAKAIEKKRLTLQNLNYQMELEKMVEERSSELLKTQKFLHSVLESSTEYFIIATDATGEITLFNRGAERLFGYDRSEVEGDKTILFIPGLAKGKEPESLSELLVGGMIDQVHTIVNREGREISISMTVTPIQSDDGDTGGYIWIGRDITERLAMQAQLRNHTHDLEQRVRDRTKELSEQNKTLEDTLSKLKEAQVQLLQADKMASLGQLAAGVAHEINNPIGFVNSNLGTLKKYITTVQEYFHAVDRALAGGKKGAREELKALKKAKKVDFILDDFTSVIKESLEGTERVKTIVRDLKDFSYQDKNGLTDYDLNEGIQSTLNIVWNELKYKGEVIEELGEIPPVRCYPQQINQVFMNLLVNAAQAIPDKGKITVRSYQQGEEVCVEVSDDGVGIDSENLSKIYEPFYTTKEVGQGTGLGLAISYRIVEKHAGRIEVKSEKGGETTFRIHLRIDGPPNQAERTESAAIETLH